MTYLVYGGVWMVAAVVLGVIIGRCIAFGEGPTLVEEKRRAWDGEIDWEKVS